MEMHSDQQTNQCNGSTTERYDLQDYLQWPPSHLPDLHAPLSLTGKFCILLLYFFLTLTSEFITLLLKHNQGFHPLKKQSGLILPWQPHSLPLLPPLQLMTPTAHFT